MGYLASFAMYAVIVVIVLYLLLTFGWRAWREHTETLRLLASPDRGGLIPRDESPRCRTIITLENQHLEI